MSDFSEFKKMITPTIIKFLFWVLSIASVVLGIFNIYASFKTNNGGLALLGVGILWIIVGPLAVRIWCETLIVVFSINDSLTDVCNILRKQATGTLEDENGTVAISNENNINHERPYLSEIDGKEFVIIQCPKCGHTNQFRKNKEGTVQHCTKCDEGFVLPSI